MLFLVLPTVLMAHNLEHEKHNPKHKNEHEKISPNAIIVLCSRVYFSGHSCALSCAPDGAHGVLTGVVLE